MISLLSAFVYFQQQNEGNFSANYLTGQFNYRTHPDFVKIPEKFTTKPIYLHKKTAAAYEKMYAAAAKEGVLLTLISGTRNFAEQKAIWERKWHNRMASFSTEEELAKNILLYSSMPMTSRHHWGTDIDLINLENDYFKSGEGLKAYEWLKQNASNYGFCQVYTDKSSGRTGYEMERWHWSYMPLSNALLNQYNSKITYALISGFEGSTIAQSIGAIEHYVNGVDSCDNL